jgi:rhodanese-related sulfurtransferase
MAATVAHALPGLSGMPVNITRDRVQQLAAGGALLVEVLPPEEYDSEHLPGAINLPLGNLTRETASEKLPGGRPIIVYCQDAT